MKKLIMITIMGFVSINLSSVAMQKGAELPRGRSSVIIGTRTERPHVLPTSASTPTLSTDRKRQLKRSGAQFLSDTARKEAGERYFVAKLVAGARAQANNNSNPQENQENKPDPIALLKLGAAGERSSRVSWHPDTEFYEDEKPKE